MQLMAEIKNIKLTAGFSKIKRIAAFFSIFILCADLCLAGSVVTFKSGATKNLLIELFSSQGCSSCPPADSWLNNLVNDKALWERIVPAAYHVDYWDSIGWKDPFDSNEFTKMQYDYQKNGKLSSIYTPGFMYNGEEWGSWYKAKSPPLPNDEAGILSVKIDSGHIS